MEGQQKKELHIIVAGRPITGKTTVATLLQKVLESAGFEVEFIPDEYERHHPETISDLDARLSGLSQCVRIVIEQRQLHRALPLANI